MAGSSCESEGKMDGSVDAADWAAVVVPMDDGLATSLGLPPLLAMRQARGCRKAPDASQSCPSWHRVLLAISFSGSRRRRTVLGAARSLRRGRLRLEGERKGGGWGEMAG